MVLGSKTPNLYQERVKQADQKFSQILAAIANLNQSQAAPPATSAAAAAPAATSATDPVPPETQSHPRSQGDQVNHGLFDDEDDAPPADIEL